MDSHKKHIGKIQNTDQRCLVVFMQIPGRESHALVIPTDSLTPRMEQAVMDLALSNEGQAEATLANILNRRMLPETGKTVLQTLHESNLLQPVPVSNVVMMPLPNMPFPLPYVLAQMGKTVPPVSPEEAVQAPSEKFNPYTNNYAARTAEDKQAIARNLLVQAADLEAEVRAKREQAYNIAPELRPTEAVAAAPVVADLEKVVAETTTKKAKRTSSRSKAKTAE